VSWKDDPGRRVLQEAQRKKSPRKGKQGAGGKKGPDPAVAARKTRWHLAISGFILGLLTWLIAVELGAGTLPIPGHFHQFVAAGAVGALVSLVPLLRRLLWAVAGFLCAAMLLIGYTPIVKGPTQQLVRADPLRPAEAVVVLSSSIRKTGEMDTPFQVRVLRGYEILRQGYARHLVVTRLAASIGKHSYVPAVQQQMRLLGFDHPVLEVGPVTNTRDEALAVADLVREKKWSHVILVTDPTHMRRAGATFERAGVRVIHSPCRNPDYDLATLESPRERIRAFQEWFHEVIGYEVYRKRGWL
jgi:uncharacterized SAM-binding protein YcdF (DUF218 family)